MRPCVALLHSFDEATGANEDPEVSLIPKLDAQEVAAVFTAPFRNFLRMTDVESEDGGDSEEWYQGAWTEWHQSNWRSKFRSFFLSFAFFLLSAFFKVHIILLLLFLFSFFSAYFTPLH